jgi:phytoene synthase
MVGMDPALHASYELCRRMHRRHDPTYYWATRRLPAEVRPATHALYGYVRTADQIVDGPRRQATPAARRETLDAWEAELRRGRGGHPVAHPVVGALLDAAARHGLPLDELDGYLRSMRIDCAPVRIASWEELAAYMDGSAGSVGRMMAPLLGLPGDHHADLGRLGQAFQLTNFLRDVREDWEMDRVYLPAEDRERYGVTEDDLASGRQTAGLRALLAYEVARARALFAAAAPAVAAAPAAVRPGMRLACAAYGRVLDKVEAGADVLRAPAALRARDWPGIVWAAARA